MRTQSRTAAPGCRVSSPRRVGRRRGLAPALMLAAVTGFSSAAADEPTRFELDDGTVIVGEALGLADGVFRIRTQSLGDIAIDAARIRSMQRASAPAAAPTVQADANRLGAATFGDAGAPADYASQIQTLQQQMVSDSGVMESIMALQGDPELQRALEDPELIGLITSGNLEALRSNAAFGRLMNHPGIRAIIEQLTGTGGALH
jgi:hypothetical protein